MIFPQAQDGGISRHPSQLYEAGLEGLALLWCFGFIPASRDRSAEQPLCLPWVMGQRGL